MSALVTSIFDQIVGPLSDSLTPQAAELILKFKLDPAMQARIGVLASKANEGTLSDAERAEYSEYVEAMDLVAILRVKAEQTLGRQVR